MSSDQSSSSSCRSKYYSSTSSSKSTSSTRATRLANSTVMELEVDISRGISFKKFLVSAFRLEKEALSRLLNQATKWAGRARHAQKLKEFEAASHKRTERVDEPFVELGNTLLDEVMSDTPPERRIKFLATNNPGVEDNDGGKRFPDICIVPADVANSTLNAGEKFDWSRISMIGEVRHSDERRTAKRVVETESDDEGPPQKRSRSHVSVDVSSSVSTAGPGIARDGGVALTCTTGSSNEQDSIRSGLSESASSQGLETALSSDDTLCRGSTEFTLARHHECMFSSWGDRTFAIGFCIHGTVMKLVLYSRSGIVESDEIDLLSQSRLLAILLRLIVISSLPELGFNASTGFRNPFNVDDIETSRLAVKLDAIGAGGNNQKLQPHLAGNVRIGENIACSRGIVGRGTCVYRLDVPGYSPGLVFKYTWQLKTKRCEVEATKIAREADPVHTPEIFASATVKDSSPLGTLRKACRRKSERYEERELRIIVMREYLPVVRLGLEDDFWEVFAQLLGCSHELYRKKGLLHHDISIYNLAYYRNEIGKIIGVLIDFELAVTSSDEQPPSQERSGTVPFMAHEYMYYPQLPYRLHHEFESYMYCAIWHGLGYDEGSEMPCAKGEEHDLLYTWRLGTWSEMTSAKYRFLATDIANEILSHIKEEKFAKRCTSLVDRFYLPALKEAYDAVLAGRPCPKYCDPIDFSGSKLTYISLVKALGMVPDECAESCCAQDS